MEDKRNYPYGGMPYGEQRSGLYPAAYAPPAQVRRQIGGLEQTQVLTGEGFKPLTREERAEVARIAAEAGFSFDGYQVVRREFFSHKFDPTLTIRNNGIIFNNACISKLAEVVYVQVLVNPMTEKLVIRPCAEGARDAIRWCVAKEDKRKSRQISCSLFTEKLYDMMGWEELYRYKLQGTIITYQGEQLYVFDLTSKEIYIPATKEVTADGTEVRKKAVVRFDANGDQSFGLSVDDHAASVQVDLNEGFDMVEVSQSQVPEQVPMEMIDQDTGEVTRV